MLSPYANLFTFNNNTCTRKPHQSLFHNLNSRQVQYIRNIYLLLFWLILRKIQTSVFLFYNNKLGMLIYYYLINSYSVHLLSDFSVLNSECFTSNIHLLQYFWVSQFIFIKSNFHFDDINFFFNSTTSDFFITSNIIIQNFFVSFYILHKKNFNYLDLCAVRGPHSTFNRVKLAEN